MTGHVAALLTFILVAVPWPGQNVNAIPVALAMARYFPVNAQQMAMCLAYFENRTYDPFKVSPTGDYGVMQINLNLHRGRIAKLGLTPTDLFVVDTNVMVAADIWEEQSFNPWTTYWAFCRR